MASRGFGRICVPPVIVAGEINFTDVASRSSDLVHRLDETVWSSIAEYEPSSAILQDWANSQTAEAVFGSFGVQNSKSNVMGLGFRDVYTLFAHVGLPLDHFVNRFRYMPCANIGGGCSTEQLYTVADGILKHFSSKSVGGGRFIACHDVYRLLEIIGCSLERFKALFQEASVVQDSPGNGQPLVFGSYRVRRQVGQGFNGARCYLGEHVGDLKKVAVKWPATKHELNVVKEIDKRTQKVYGLPELLATGVHLQKPYMVSELLGSTLSKVFHRLEAHSLSSRWKCLRIIGRMAVRRLQALHVCGYVHCDVSPENFLLGRSWVSLSSGTATTVYLIDFELAQKFPDGTRLQGNVGSTEWSSIRSADLVERIPEDDLESLGWVLIHGLIGPLPWFDWLNVAYKHWDSKWNRDQVVRQATRAKEKLLDNGWRSFGSMKAGRVPSQLWKFLRKCRSMSASPGHTNYLSLIEILGGDTNLSTAEAEEEDVRLFSKLVLPLI